MAVRWGDEAVIDGASVVRQWQVDYNEEENPYAATDTKGGTDFQCGNLDWTGAYAAYGGTPLKFPGESLAFKGEAAGDLGCSGTAITERVQVLWNQAKNDYISHIVYFGGNGDLFLGGVGALSDASVPSEMYCSGDAHIKLDGAALSNVQGAMLDLSARHGRPPGQIGNPPYATGGKVRRVKGRIYWTAWVDVLADPNFSQLPQPRSIYELQMYTTATKYWDLNYARVLRLENMGANTEDTELIKVRIHLAMKGIYGSVYGSIIDPEGVTKWPT
jgi:hypothetical protein